MLASPVVGATLTGLSVMAATDTTMARLGVGDPRSWKAADWVSDLVPHLVYGGGHLGGPAGHRPRPGLTATVRDDSGAGA